MNEIGVRTEHPLIGINGYFTETDVPRVSSRMSYVDAIVRAGGVPVIVPPAGAERELRRLVGMLDGLVLSGGDDFDMERLGRGATHPAAVRTPATKQDFDMLEIMVWAGSDGEHYIIGDPNKGLYFCFINEAGEISRELNVPYKKVKVSAAYRRKSLSDYKKRLGSGAADHARRFNYVYPEYFPPFNSFKIDKPFIYAFTHQVKDGKRECLVINYNGDFVGKISLPSGYPSTIYRGKMYYLVDNEDEELLELHRIETGFTD